MAKSKIEFPKANKGYGYAGVWTRPKDGPIVGWMAPAYLVGGSRKYPDMPDEDKLKAYAKGERLFLCEITMKPVKDKKGRPITKIVK